MMHTAKRRSRRNDKQEPTGEVSEISNHYVPGSRMTVDELLICRQCCPFQASFNPEKYRLKIWATCDSVTL